MRRTGWAVPVAVAAAMTLTNAVKPVVVDDTAYLLYARHLAARPLDPYGFELFWYSRPLPAMETLAPPVVPYWLAAGVALFGEHLFLLKLWLFPFALAFCLAASSLLRRFARGTEQVGVVMLGLGPAVLPLVNFMLDVPAVAVGLAAVSVLVRGIDRGRWGPVLAAGVLAGVAAQTKYTAITLPAVFVWYGLLRRRVGFAVAAVAVAVAVFVGWEGVIAAKYGESHFLHHARGQQSDEVAAASGLPGKLSAWLDDKGDLVNPLLGHLGGLAVAWGLFAGCAVGFPRRFVAAVGVVAAAGMVAVCLVPYSDAVLLRSHTGTPRLDLPAAVFYPLGVAVLATIALAIAVLGFRIGRGPLGWLRRDPGAWFLIGWLGIELAAYFALTPFPAARRVIPLCVVLGLIACRLVSRVRRVRPDRAPGRWVPVHAVALGFGLFALDAWDALPERELAYRTAEVVGKDGVKRTWFQGHWAWQYYCDRLGMRPVVPGESQLRAGDWLAVPVLPNEKGFYRPYHGQAVFRIDPTAVEKVAELWWDDPLPAQTIPSLYGGWSVPVHGRDHPRLRIAVYRVTRDWVPQPDPRSGYRR